MYFLIIILIVILLYFYNMESSEKNTNGESRIKRWKNSLPKDASWWDNAKKSENIFVLGT